MLLLMIDAVEGVCTADELDIDGDPAPVVAYSVDA